MTTALQLITSSLRLLGAVASGETPDAAEQSDALSVLNQLIESWNLQGLALYRLRNDAYTLVPSQQSYSVGAGGNFNGTRPITLNGAFVTRNGLDYPLEVLTQSQWNAILNKSLASQMPMAIYYDPVYPAGFVRIYPVPLEALPITLAVNLQLLAVAAVGEALAFPPGYERALRYALAVELAPEYPAIALNPLVVETAADALGLIKAANNTQLAPATFDSALTGRGVGGGTLAAFMAGY